MAQSSQFSRAARVGKEGFAAQSAGQDLNRQALSGLCTGFAFEVDMRTRSAAQAPYAPRLCMRVCVCAYFCSISSSRVRPTRLESWCVRAYVGHGVRRLWGREPRGLLTMADEEGEDLRAYGPRKRACAVQPAALDAVQSDRQVDGCQLRGCNAYPWTRGGRVVLVRVCVRCIGIGIQADMYCKYN